MNRILLFSLLAVFANGSIAAERPNIVFIFSDDHCEQALARSTEPQGVIDAH